VSDTERARVVRIAKSYIGTKYHNHGMLKNAGVDCLTLLVLVYKEAGLISDIEIPYYSPDFMKHKSKELYLEGLLKYTHEVDKPLPGDIALWRFGRCFSHAAIVIKWPFIIHAHINRSCMMENVENALWLKMAGIQTRPVKYFSYWKN